MSTSGRHVAKAADDEDDTPLIKRHAPLRAKLERPFADASRLAGSSRSSSEGCISA